MKSQKNFRIKKNWLENFLQQSLVFFPQLLHYYRKSKLFLCFSLFLGANVTGYKINLSIMICVLKHLKLFFIKIIFFVRIWKRQTYAQMSCVGMFFSLVYLDKVEPQFIENLLRNSLRWPIYIINSVDETKLSGYTPLPTYHYSFFKSLPPSFLLVPRIDWSEYHFHWPSLFFFPFFFFFAPNLL